MKKNIFLILAMLSFSQIFTKDLKEKTITIDLSSVPINPVIGIPMVTVICETNISDIGIKKFSSILAKSLTKVTISYTILLLILSKIKTSQQPFTLQYWVNDKNQLTSSNSKRKKGWSDSFNINFGIVLIL